MMVVVAMMKQCFYQWAALCCSVWGWWRVIVHSMEHHHGRHYLADCSVRISRNYIDQMRKKAQAVGLRLVRFPFARWGYGDMYWGKANETVLAVHYGFAALLHVRSLMGRREQHVNPFRWYAAIRTCKLWLSKLVNNNLCWSQVNSAVDSKVFLYVSLNTLARHSIPRCFLLSTLLLAEANNTMSMLGSVSQLFVKHQ